jgi:peptidoglycan/LPS O-acetylase OafA/YrhL
LESGRVAAIASAQPASDAVVVPAPAPRDARVLQLDVLRGVAILLVLGAHSPTPARRSSGLLRPLDLLLHQFGWTGVDLFFVLSGYLIGGLLFSEIKRYGSIDVPRFLTRRMLRIWPAYYTLLVFVVLRESFLPGSNLADAWSRTWPAFVHIQNFIEVPRTQLWSLANEEHFYLVLPLFLWLLTRGAGGLTVAVVPLACAVMSVVCLALRSYFILFTEYEVRMPMDALFFGVNLAYLKAYKPALLESIAKRRWLLIGAAGLLFMPVLLSLGKLRLTLGLSCLYLGYAALLVCFTHLPVGAWASWRITRLVAFIGTHSYSIYLWHRDTSWGAYEFALSLGHRLGLPLELTWLLHTLAYVVAAIVGGVVMGRLIETPVQRIRERLFPSRLAQS